MIMKLADVEQDIWQQGVVNREHLLDFLRLLPTSDTLAIRAAVKDWLLKLHHDPKFSKVSFPEGDISRILDDLASYDRVRHETIIGAPPTPEVGLKENG